MKTFLTVLAAIVVTAGVWAQSPEKISYQAVIRNSSNQLITNQAVGIRISILQGSVSGTVVYSETFTPATNANGLISVEIGGAAGFNAINWANGPYFIKTETDPAGGVNYTIVGTSQILSVPYAIHSKTAETLAGGITETDPLWTSVSADYYTKTNMQTSGASQLHFNNLTNKPATVAGYGITDAMTTAHAAYGITTANITNWNSAFGWGNHAGLYRPVSYVPAWSEITSNPFAFSQVANNQLIRYNTTSGKWENWTPNYLTSFTETDPLWTSASANYYTKTNMQTSGASQLHFSNLTNKPTTVAGYGITDAHDNWGTQTVVADATLSGNGSAATPLKIAHQSATTGQVLKWNGTTWLPAADLTGSSGWLLTGNAGTSASSNFIGTTDDVPLSIKVNNMLSGKIDRLLYNTSFGYQSLSSNTTGVSNTAFGDEALYLNTTGYDNTSIGHKALVSNTTGSSNTAVGTTALSSNNIGKDNTSIGNSALRFNDTGNENNAVGKKALFFNSSGSGNIAIGTNSLGSNTTGSRNTAVGTRSLCYNDKNSRSTAIGVGAMYNADDNTTTGAYETYNTAVGYEALRGSNTPGNNTGKYNTAVGDQAMYSNSTGYSNAAIGTATLYSNTTGNFNTAIGIVALTSNTSGNENSVIGFSALSLNTTGSLNTAVGTNALFDNTSGSNNIALGNNSLFSNVNNSRSTAIGVGAMSNADDNTTSDTRETYNTAVGYEALRGSDTPGNNTGQWNTAVGDQAMYSNSTGSWNAAFGYAALSSNTTGYANTAIAQNALSANTTGFQNTAVGATALVLNNTGNLNTAIGNSALGFNITGNENNALGVRALFYNNSGSGNIAIGTHTLESNITGNNNTASGNSALKSNKDGSENTATGVNALTNNTSGNFNTASGMHALIGNTTGSLNVAEGRYALSGNTTGNYNTGIGCIAGDNNQTGSYITCVGYDADVSGVALTNATALGSGALVNASNKVVVGNTSVTSIGGYAGWSNFSDGRFKKNLSENVPGLAFILQLRPVTYNLDISSLFEVQGRNKTATTPGEASLQGGRNCCKKNRV